ncbi:MAG: MFS transporter [Gammaproteobacteria bacterium]
MFWRRMGALAASSGLFFLAEAGFNVIGPLWAAHDLGLGNDDWAFLRSANACGGFAAILALGLLAERLGSRLASALSLGGFGLALAGLGVGAGTVALMALLGAFSSIIYVGYNTLTQQVAVGRAGLANAIYRASGAIAAIVAPTLATQGAPVFGRYGPVMVAGALLVGLAGVAVLAIGGSGTASARRRPFGESFTGFRRWFRSRPLLSFIALTRAFGVATAAIGAFAALRFTRELGLSGAGFGALCSAIAVVSLAALAASGWVVDRLGPSRTLGIAWAGCSAASLALGLCDSPAIAMTAYAVFLPLHALCSVPLSLWSAQLAGEAPDGAGHNAVFTVQKLFQSGVTMLAMALLGVLEPLVGMSTLMWLGGVLGLPLAAAVLRLGVAQRV